MEHEPPTDKHTGRSVARIVVLFAVLAFVAASLYVVAVALQLIDAALWGLTFDRS